MTDKQGRDGFRTSEFVVAVLIIVAASLMLLTHNIGEPLWAELVKWIGGAYVISRGLAK
jgi:uncharacterized protein (DUF983 family)